MRNELCYLPATEAINRFRARTLSPVELLEAVIDQSERLNETVNAFTEELHEAARAEAKASEQRYASGRATGPLDGIPVAIKEEQPIKGLTHCEGWAPNRARIASDSHAIVERIVEAGGIIHARTTTPEFCAAGFTQTRLWGVTRNPWNTRYSSGGSSGGSGAALAAGMTTLATGSDIGGSIRIPASFNGVVGFKPPYGRVPGHAPFNLDHYCHDGPMARTVADCALLENVIAGQHPADHASIPAPASLAPDAAVAGRRVALCMTLGDFAVEPEVESAVRAAADALATAGVAVEEIRLPWKRADIAATAWAHYGALFAGSIEAELSSDQIEALEPYTRDFVRRGAHARTPTSYARAVAVEAQIHESLANVFAEYDALICPTSGIPALVAGEDYVENPPVVNGIEVGHHLEAALTIPFNIASRCPVLSVPVGRSSENLPIGLQVVSKPYDDETAFDIAVGIESNVLYD